MVIVTRVKGTAAERGRQQGEQLKVKIDAMLDFVLHSDLINQMKPWWLPLGVLKWGLGLLGKRKVKKALEQHMPHQVAKIDGISAGAGLKRNFNYGIHFVEVVTGLPQTVFVNPPKQDLQGACSMIFALAAATRDGTALFGRNYDFPNALQPYQMVRVDEPTDGFYKSITMSQFPLAGAHVGMNEHGLCVGVNYGRAWKKKPLDFRLDGVPCTLMVQETLETCTTTAEAMEFLSQFPARSNGAHYGLLDKGGHACVVETTSTRFGIREPDVDGLLAHTNDYRSAALVDANVPEDTLWKIEGMEVPYLKSPRERHDMAYAHLQEYKGRIDVETMQGILREHGGQEPSDFTLCCHGEAGSTLASIICHPETGRLWVTDDKPCQSEYEEFQL